MTQRDDHAAKERRFGDIATRLLFENDRVRIWQLKLEPGGESDLHRHELDHILVQIAGDRIAVVPDADTEGPYDQYLEAPVVPGQTIFVQRGGVETARNVGRERYREIVIELKD